jgi:hypothetical protein
MEANQGNIRCVVCQELNLVDNVTAENLQDIELYFICDSCETIGWWFDPAGGLHSPSEQPEDYAAQYE